MRRILLLIGLFFMLGVAQADDRNRDFHREHHLDRKLLQEIRELKIIVMEMKKDIAELRHMLRHRRNSGYIQEGRWGCSVQPPWNEPTYFGVGFSKAMATAEALEKCSVGAKLDNRKYCSEGRVTCSEQQN